MDGESVQEAPKRRYGIKPGVGGITPDNWTKRDVLRARRKFNEKHGLITPGGRPKSLYTAANKTKAKKREQDPLKPVIPKLAGPRVPVGSILEAVKPYATFYECEPYQLAVDAARKIVYKYPQLARVVQAWDNCKATERRKKLALDWIVEHLGLERDEFKALVLTVLREEAIEKAQDLQIVNIAKLTAASLQFAEQGMSDAASKERIKHLEKHNILLPPPKQGGVTVQTLVQNATPSLPSADDWAKTLAAATDVQARQLPAVDFESVIEAEILDDPQGEPIERNYNLSTVPEVDRSPEFERGGD